MKLKASSKIQIFESLMALLKHIKTVTIYRPFLIVGKKSYVEKPLKLLCPGSIRLGDRSFVKKHFWLLAIKPDSKIHIGDNSQVGNFAHVVALDTIEIGDNSLIADKVFITDCSHGFENSCTPYHAQPLKRLTEGRLLIGAGSWIGESVSIIGASVGEGSIIGANSVVLEDIPSWCIAVGAPAKVVKRLDIETGVWIRETET